MANLISQRNFWFISYSFTNKIIIKCEYFIFIIIFFHKFWTGVTTHCWFYFTVFWISPNEYLISVPFIRFSTEWNCFLFSMDRNSIVVFSTRSWWSFIKNYFLVWVVKRNTSHLQRRSTKNANYQKRFYSSSESEYLAKVT